MAADSGRLGASWKTHRDLHLGVRPVAEAWYSFVLLHFRGPPAFLLSTVRVLCGLSPGCGVSMGVVCYLYSELT